MRLGSLGSYVRNNKIRSLFAVFSMIALLVATSFHPIGGYMIAGGDSMKPTYSDGCGVMMLDDWNGESSLENRIVLYKPNYTETSVNFAGKQRDHNYYIIHRVVEGYQDYNPDTANHTITEYGYFKSVDGKDIKYQETDQPRSSIEDLRGERVIITKGDNNDSPDPEIIPANRVISTTEEDDYISFPFC